MLRSRLLARLLVKKPCAHPARLRVVEGLDALDDFEFGHWNDKMSTLIEVSLVFIDDVIGIAPS